MFETQYYRYLERDIDNGPSRGGGSNPGTTTTCEKELGDAVTLYYAAVGAIAGATLCVYVAYRFCLKSRLDGAPGLDAQFRFVSGLVNIAAGIVLFVLLQPRCPTLCAGYCSSDDASHHLPLPIYPVICGLMGLCIVRTGLDKLRVANLVSKSGDDNNPDDAIFDPVSTIEI